MIAKHKSSPVAPAALASLPAYLREPMAEGLAHAARVRSSPGEIGRALVDLFAKCLPLLLTEYAELLRDWPDLQRAVRVGLPVVLCKHLQAACEDQTLAKLFPLDLLAHIHCIAQLFEWRLDGSMDSGFESELGSKDPSNPYEAAVVSWLEDAVREFSLHVLIGPPQPPATPLQRAAARKHRYDAYVAVLERQGIQTSFSEVCRKAGVERKGRGSGAQWLNGLLPDEAKTARAIEGVLAAPAAQKIS